MKINMLPKKFINFIGISILICLSIFEIKILDREIKAEKKLLPATEKDLYLYKGMGASYLCIASKAGIEFPKAVGVATATYVQVIEGKHGGSIKELGNKKLEREKLFAGAEFQIVTTALQYCPDSVPNEYEINIIKVNSFISIVFTFDKPTIIDRKPNACVEIIFLTKGFTFSP